VRQRGRVTYQPAAGRPGPSDALTSPPASLASSAGTVASSTPEDCDRDVRALESRRAQRASHGTVRDPDAHSTFNGYRFSPFECLDLSNGPSAYERSKAEEARGENKAKFGRSLGEVWRVMRSVIAEGQGGRGN